MKNWKAWREEIKKHNPYVSEHSLDFLQEREELVERANQWVEEMDEYVPYIKQAKRIQLFELIGLSLSEGIPELWDITQQAKTIFKKHRRKS